MSDSSITVESLSKSYMVGHQTAANERYTALRDVVARHSRNLLRKSADLLRGRPIVQGDDVEEFFAVKDVSFKITQGETVGVIGRNGAGKSTLLKLLSRITEPTSGRIRLRGRVASLLEVGTGFHPELTGRENIFLNGAILGMTRLEIRKKFDEIVAFSEVERFLDTPVKRYSSGMYVRLAFAVAAHLEPEILIVDEVLAVGDAQFQQKCLGKMGDVAKLGRTILFVSHNMSAVKQLCSRALLMKAGRLEVDGPTSTVVATYFEKPTTSQDGDLTHWPDRDRHATGQARIVQLTVHSPNPDEAGCIRMGDSLRITMKVNFSETVVQPTFGILIHSASGEPLLDVRSVHCGMKVPSANGLVEIELVIANLSLYPGEYWLSPWVADETQRTNLDWAKNVFVLLVTPSEFGTDDLSRAGVWGKYWVPSEWKFQACVAASR